MNPKAGYQKPDAKGKRCPKCGSLKTYIRIRTHEMVCQSCGKVTDLNAPRIKWREV